MTFSQSIIDFEVWLNSPPGRYLLDWEQAQLDEALADVFGFHAIQFGLADWDMLRTNRMRHRWQVAIGGDAACQAVIDPGQKPMAGLSAAALHPSNLPPNRQPVRLICQPETLPFPSDSLDLIVLPHTLELVEDAHLTLAEVARVLRPEGRVVVTGLNPWSSWGMRQHMSHLRRRAGDHEHPLFIPQAADWLSHQRVKDWLRLLGLEIAAVDCGAYKLPLSSARWLRAHDWLDTLGQRAWTSFGAVYCVQAVKRVRGMRWVGLSRKSAPMPAQTPAAVVGKHGAMSANADLHQ